jgi:hypothetical protein
MSNDVADGATGADELLLIDEVVLHALARLDGTRLGLMLGLGVLEEATTDGGGAGP